MGLACRRRSSAGLAFAFRNALAQVYLPTIFRKDGFQQMHAVRELDATGFSHAQGLNDRQGTAARQPAAPAAWARGPPWQLRGGIQGRATDRARLIIYIPLPLHVHDRGNSIHPASANSYILSSVTHSHVTRDYVTDSHYSVGFLLTPHTWSPASPHAGPLVCGLGSGQKEVDSIWT